MPDTPDKPGHHSRSSVSGQYVTDEEATAHPRTTTTEQVAARRARLSPLSDAEVEELYEACGRLGAVGDEFGSVVDLVNRFIHDRG